MRIKSYLKAILITTIVVLTACDNSVDFGEQYKKILYIVNSENIPYISEHHFNDSDDFINISVYRGGTEPDKKDVTVRFEKNQHMLDSINRMFALANPLYINKKTLPEENYTLASNPTATIKSGHEYGVLSIPFTFDGLNPDSCYILPLAIESNSENYDINNELRTILYEVKMINDFSGDYSGSSTELPKTIRSVQPNLKAMSANVVRMPIHTLSDDIDNLETNFMLLTVAPDSVNVSITPWKDAKVTDLGGSMYNSKRKYFHLNYSFIDKSGNEVIVQEKITNLEYEMDEMSEMDEDEKATYLIVSPLSVEKLRDKGGDVVFTLYTDEDDQWEYRISDNADWLKEKEKTETTLTLMADVNSGDERSATVTFSLVSNPTVTKVFEIAQAEKIVPVGIQIFEDNSITSSSIGSNGYGGTNSVTATINGSEITIKGNLINYSSFPNQTMTLSFVPDSPESTSGKITFEPHYVGESTRGTSYYYYPTKNLGTYDTITGEIRFSIWIYYGAEDNPTYWYEDDLLIKVI